MNSAFCFESIGHYLCQRGDIQPFDVARQASESGMEGSIELRKDPQILQGISDLVPGDRLWILWVANQSTSWKGKVITPRSPQKIGVFSTRSPYRPNNICMSSAVVLSVAGNRIGISSNDMLHNTPVLDIKPYLSYADAYSDCEPAWCKTTPEFEVQWSEHLLEKKEWLSQYLPGLINCCADQLRHWPFPHPHKRIKQQQDDLYILSYRTWRILYQISEASNIQKPEQERHLQQILILSIDSGYSPEELEQNTEDPWNDKELHRQFANL